ncbi:MAG: hypothetical protein AAF933_04455 [Pseudomonadota bacterium]
MKPRIVFAALVASLFLIGPGTASADYDDRRRIHGGWDHRDRWDDRRRFNRNPYFRQWDRRFRRGYWDRRFRGGYDWRFDRRRYWGLGAWNNNWYWTPPPHRYRYRQNRGVGLVGGAIIGATATRLLLQSQGDDRYVDYDRRPSCYRIEHDASGRERRVPLPDTACF